MPILEMRVRLFHSAASLRSLRSSEIELTQSLRINGFDTDDPSG
jgi:hypothetical protein